MSEGTGFLTPPGQSFLDLLFPEQKAESDQLVVDLQHWPTIKAVLDDLGVEYGSPVEEDPDLGLALVTNLVDGRRAPVDLDELLAELRHRFAGERQGLAPLVGKNRFVDAIVGAGHKIMAAHKIMGGGLPEVGTAEGTVNSAAPTVATEDEFAQGKSAAPEAGTGVRIGMVDTPMSSSAVDTLAVRTKEPMGVFLGPAPYRAGHSQFVASLIRQQAPAATIHLEGVINRDSGRANSWDTARAIMRLAVQDQIDILNLSLGCFAATGPPFVITRAIERISPRVLVVAAAGNHGEIEKWVQGRTHRSAVWPAAIPPVIAVGAHNPADQTPAPWSPNLSWVACTAPGVDVIGRFFDDEVELPSGTEKFHGFARWSGTSFAAATVTGAIAAQTRPGSVTPRMAFDNLLDSGGIVRKFTFAERVRGA
jgi:hypothetical protein